MSGRGDDAKILELASTKLKEVDDLLTRNGYDDWGENLRHIKAEIDEEAIALKQ